MRIDGYDKPELIHQSDQSRVYRAVRLVDGRQAVLKTPAAVNPQAGRIRSLRREFRVLRSLDITGVPRAFELIETDRSVVLAMSRFDGQPLSRLIAAGPLDLSAFFTMALGAAAVLARLHRRNLTHCRLNDGAVLFNPHTGRAALVELTGVREATDLARPLITPRRVSGSAAFASPEQTGLANRSLDHRTDFYSLGAVFYKALTGRPPFEADDPTDLIQAHLTVQPEAPDRLNPDLPPDLAGLVMKLLAKEPVDRYRSAEGLIDDLKACRGRFSNPKPTRSFRLGQTDRTDRLLMQEKLYNRGGELKKLLQAFDQAARGRGQTVFISGEAGMGKTTLVRELEAPLSRRNGYLVRGRFEQGMNHVPYSGFTATFLDLGRQILNRPPAEAAAWKERLLKAAGANSRLLIAASSEMGRLLGPQPEAADLPVSEAKLRFGNLIHSLISVCAAPDRPLVFFLDNLQWIDSSSMELLELLTNSISEAAILLIGAYRNGEAPPDHPLNRLLGRLRETSPGMLELQLTELGPENLVEFLSETLSLPWGELVELNDWLFQRAGGNPLYYKALLASLYDDGLLAYDHRRNRWSWDLREVREIPRVTSPADLLRRRFNHPAGTGVDLLGPAALIGRQFDLDLLAGVVGRSRRRTADLLRKSVTNGLLQPLNDDYEVDLEDRTDRPPPIRFTFGHDFVRRAALALVAPEDRPAMHTLIGRLLFNRLREAQSGELIFEAADHLNRGAVPERKNYRIGLARLNLAAGEEAKAAASFSNAIHYFEAALRALGSDPWSEHPALALEVHLRLAEAGGLVSGFDRAEELFTQIRRRAATPDDLLALLNIQIRQYRRQDRRRETIDLGCEALALLGLKIPRKEENLIGLVQDEEAKINALLDGVDPETIFELDETDDPDTIRLHEFLFSLHRDGKRAGRPVLAAYAAATAARLTLGRGVCPISAVGLINHAVRLCADGRYEAGGAFGRAALRLAERSPNALFRSYTYHRYALGVNHWFQSLTSSCDYWRKAAEAALESGSSETGGIFVHLTGALFVAGAPLDQVERKFNESIRYLTAARQDDLATALQLLVGRPLDRLRGRTRISPTEIEFDPASILKKAKDVDSFSAGGCYGRLRGLFMQGEYQPLSVVRECTARCNQIFPGEILQADCTFFAALHLTRGYNLAPDRDKPDYQLALREALDRFTVWARLVPENFLHKKMIIEAESYRLAGDSTKALDRFKQAAETAQNNNFLNDAALVPELAGLMRLDQGRPDLAAPCLEQAVAAYDLWGASGRADWLKAKYPDLIRPPQSDGATLNAAKTARSRRPCLATPRGCC